MKEEYSIRENSYILDKKNKYFFQQLFFSSIGKMIFQSKIFIYPSTLLKRLISCLTYFSHQVFWMTPCQRHLQVVIPQQSCQEKVQALSLVMSCLIRQVLFAQGTTGGSKAPMHNKISYKEWWLQYKGCEYPFSTSWALVSQGTFMHQQVGSPVLCLGLHHWAVIQMLPIPMDLRHPFPLREISAHIQVHPPVPVPCLWFFSMIFRLIGLQVKWTLG